MQREKKTKITVSEDYPVSIASEAYGANIGSMAFNINYISLRDPLLALEVMKLFEKCKSLKGLPVLGKDSPEFTKAYKYLKEFLYADSD